MKKLLCLLLLAGMMLVMLPVSAQEDAAPQELIDLVREYLDSQDLSYRFDEEFTTYDLQYTLDSQLSQVKAVIWLYDDIVFVDVSSPLKVDEQHRDATGKLLNLINKSSYYAYFVLDHEDGELICRATQMINGTLPGHGELDSLLNWPLSFMEVWGNDLLKVSTQGADPAEVYQAHE